MLKKIVSPTIIHKVKQLGKWGLKHEKIYELF